LHVHRVRPSGSLALYGWTVVVLLTAASRLSAQDSQFGIDFLARPAAALRGSPGHAWICLYHGPETGPPQRECVGFYPKSIGQTALGLITATTYPAVVNEDDVESDPGKTAIVGFHGSITKAQYVAVRQIVADWKTRGYSLAWQNCTDFVDAVALAAGLDEPVGAAPRYPPSFIAALGAKNPDRLRPILPASAELSVAWLHLVSVDSDPTLPMAPCRRSGGTRRDDVLVAASCTDFAPTVVASSKEES
jgi:hypothetical protein